MDPTRLMTQPATITPMVPVTDEYNDEHLEPGTPIVLDGSLGHGVFLTQSNRSETGIDTNTVSEIWALYLPPTITVDPNTQITVDDITYELDGPAWPAYNPRLHKTTHLEATVRRVA